MSTTAAASPQSTPSKQEALKRTAKIVTSLISRPESAPFLEPVDWRGLELWDYPDIVDTPMDLGTIQRKLLRQQYHTAAECASDVRLVWSNCMAYNAPKSDFWVLAKALSKRFEDRYRKIKAEYDVGEEEEEAVAEAQSVAEDEDVEEVEAEFDNGESDEEEELEDEDMDDDLDVDDHRTASSGRSSSQVPLLDAKARLASNLLLLNGVELGHVMMLLERKAPAVLERLDSGSSRNHNKTSTSHVEINIDALDAATFQELSAYADERASTRKRNTRAPPIIDISNKRKRKK